MSYFADNFPFISYNGSSAVNITERCAILSSIFQNVYTFYPYTVKNGMRARTVAERYYGDPNLDWLVYYSNNIIDPYHQWPMDDDTFNSFLTDMYGSVEAAQNTIVTYRVNWYDDDRALSQIQYNSLPSYEKKYWAPVFDQNNRVTSYIRKQIDFLAVAQDGNGNVTLSVPSEEQAYWSSVSAYDIEQEKNAYKSHIRLLDARLVSTAVDNLKTLLSS